MMLLVGCGAPITAASAGQDVQTGATGPQGAPGIVYMSVYNPATPYVYSDVVTFQGSSFFCIAPATGVAPAGTPQSTGSWTVLAAAGSNGTSGPTGPAGAAGPVGPSGPAGSIGPQGSTGLTGALGHAGPPGPAGPQGLPGPAGTTGQSGLLGPAGPAGPAGPTGPTGPTGPVGLIGPAGLTGQAGQSGSAGATGTPGLPGPAGPPGPSGPSGPAGHAGPQGQPGTPASFLQGDKLGILGDSFSALFNNEWQNVVLQRTGMTLAVQDARPGRSFATAFECWGNPALGDAPGTFHADYVFPGVGGSCRGYKNTGLADGVAFSDSLASVDLQLIVLGTNDQSFPLGQLGDAPTAGTFYGNMRWVVETYLAAKPDLRLVLVTLQYNAFASAAVNQQYANATETYGNSIGVPVINMFRMGGVNAMTTATLTRDGIHPSDTGFTRFFAPVIAQGLQQIF